MKESVGGQNGVIDPAVKHADDAAQGTPDQVARMHGTQKISYAMLGAFLLDLGAKSITLPASTTGGTGQTPAIVTANGKGQGSQCDAQGNCCDDTSCCDANGNCCDVTGACCFNDGTCVDANANPITPDAKGTGTTTTATTAGALYTAGYSALGGPVYPSRVAEMIIPSTSALAKEYDIFMAAAPEIIANIGSSTRCPGVTLITNGELTADGISCLIGKPATADHVAIAQQLVASASTPTIGQEIAVATLLAAAHISE